MAGLLRRLIGAVAPGSRDPSSDFWFTPLPYVDAMAVTPEVALRVPAVVDALNAITQPIAHLPLKVFEDLGEGNKRPAPEHPATALLQAPYRAVTPYEWRGQLQWHLGLYHNAYARIWYGPDGRPAELEPLHPHDVTPRLRPDRKTVVYQVRRGGEVEELRYDLVWHLRALPLDRDGLCGVSRVETNRETIAHALAIQAYGSRFFANDGQAGGIIEHPSGFKSSDDRDRFMRAWNEASTGASQHRTRVLEFGAKLNRFQINNEHAQFLETRKEMAIEVARIWNVPPHKLRSLERATFSNIEHQSLEFVTDTITPWVSLWEQRITRDLVQAEPAADGRRYFAEFNVNGLLRGDIRSRYQAYAVGRQWGWLSVNDIRRLENMNPLPDGDVYLQPLNMAEAGADLTEAPGDGRDQGERDEREARRLSVIRGGA